MKKKLARMTTILVTAAMLTGCGSPSTTTEDSVPSTTEPSSEETQSADASQGQDEEAVETLYDGLMNVTGYPIVNEPITLTIGYQADANFGDFSKMQWFEDLAEASGINLEFIEYADANAVSLMFTSRDYPDILFTGATERQLIDAYEAGDVYALDEYFEQYAPNWNNYLNENPLVKASLVSPDGHIYHLPCVNYQPLYALRDQWVINKDWLDELNMEVPTTIDEFYEALKAFKENAGKGSIPANAEPYYVHGITTHIGGALDLINSFGVRVTGEYTFATIDDDGKVEFNFANEAIKEPIEFMHKLVEEGLLSKEGFTDDSTTYYAKTQRASEALVGSYHAYADSGHGEVAFGPLDSGNGKKPLIRSQTATLIMRRFMVFNSCEYPEIAVRLVNMIADPDWAVYSVYGQLDGTYVVKNDDGTYYVPDTSDLPVADKETPELYAPLLMTSELASKIEFDPDFWAAKRAAAAEMYLDSMIEAKNLYPSFIMSTENADRFADLRSDIRTCVTTTLADWVLNGGIEEGWDAYISQLESMGLQEYISLLQEEYDRFSANLQ